MAHEHCGGVKHTEQIIIQLVQTRRKVLYENKLYYWIVNFGNTPPQEFPYLDYLASSSLVTSMCINVEDTVDPFPQQGMYVQIKRKNNLNRYEAKRQTNHAAS